MRKGQWILVCILFVVLAGRVRAEEISDLGKVVVTPYRYGESLDKAAADVSVISAQDIQRSGASRVVDVLRAVGGITVQDYYGNGTKANVDMAGFGEQAPLNVLVLVDGRRVNGIDLSGVDWTMVPLDQVERIEVIHGGSGAVLYGDNASSGVINIITKKGAGAPKVTLQTEYGSYAANAQKMSVSGSTPRNISYWLSGGRDSSNGYRHNSFAKNNDLSGKMDYRMNSAVSFHVDAAVHASRYGMPGALFPTNMASEGRRSARYGNDHVNNNDRYISVGTELNGQELGKLGVDVSYRSTETDSYFLTSTNPTRRNKIQVIGVMPKYTLSGELAGHENKFVAGVDLYRVGYISNNYNYSSDAFQDYTRITKASMAGYAQNELALSRRLSLITGYRNESARYAFNYHDWNGYNPDQDTTIHPTMKAFNSGLIYAYQDDSNVFLNAGRSFRFPQTDEFAYYDPSYQQQLDTGVKPQASVNVQTGVRHKFSDGVKAEVSVFRMNLKDEIYLNYLYDSNGSRNENYGRTVHQGANVSTEAALNKLISVFSNYTYTDACFNGGPYGGNKVPLVSGHQVSAGVNVLVARDVTWNMTERYTGSSFALNDQANVQGRVGGYALTDTHLTWVGKAWKTTFAISNLFDRKYSEITGYDRWKPAPFYYPGPERNFTLKAEYRF
jgi:iron complex outermembrane receptor protein